MKSGLLRASLALVLCMSAVAAFATDGNNGGGNGGCGVGQQTNGCGGVQLPPILIPGPQGIQGLKGDTGAQGIQGERGLTGATGAQGAQGVAGINGSNGERGATGAAGVNGTNGVNGAKGDKGDTGSSGVAGAAGSNGKDGVNGADGKSIKGDTGQKGENAPDAVTTSQMTGTVAAAQRANQVQLNSLREQVDSNAKASYSGVAAALAIQMPALQPSKPEALTMRVGAGFYKGESAVGISFRKGNKTGDWSVTGGISATSQGTGVAVGVEHSF